MKPVSIFSNAMLWQAIADQKVGITLPISDRLMDHQ